MIITPTFVENCFKISLNFFLMSVTVCTYKYQPKWEKKITAYRINTKVMWTYERLLAAVHIELVQGVREV